MPWYIYALCDPRETDPVKTVRYVGAAKNAQLRLKTHIVNRKKHRSHISCWLRMMVDKIKIKPTQIILAQGEEDWESLAWVEHERKWIAHYRSIGADLCNLTDGGEHGKAFLPEVGAKISKSLKEGDNSWRIRGAESLKLAYAEGRMKRPTKESMWWIRTPEFMKMCSERFTNMSKEDRRKGIANSVAARKMPKSVSDLILSLRDSGLSYQKIANELQRRNIPTQKGGKWRMESVAFVCQNRDRYA